MTDEQYESLRRHILDVKVEVEALKLLVKQIIEIQRRNGPAPSDYLDTLSEIDIPDDIKKLLGNQN